MPDGRHTPILVLTYTSSTPSSKFHYSICSTAIPLVLAAIDNCTDWPQMILNAIMLSTYTPYLSSTSTTESLTTVCFALRSAISKIIVIFHLPLGKIPSKLDCTGLKTGRSRERFDIFPPIGCLVNVNESKIKLNIFTTKQKQMVKRYVGCPDFYPSRSTVSSK